MILHRQNDLVHRHVEAFRHCLDDPDIGLVRYKPVEFFLAHTGFVERLLGDRTERLHGHFEHFVARHHDSGFTGPGNSQIAGHANRVIQQVLVLPVGAQCTGDNARLV